MAGGAVVAAAAAAAGGARRRRLAEVVEAFRAAGATAPDRARRLDEVLTGRAGEVALLAVGTLTVLAYTALAAVTRSARTSSAP